MSGNIKAIARTILIIVCVGFCTFFLIYLFAPVPDREQKMTSYHYQVPPQIAVRDKFEKRIGSKQSYTIELAWVARTPDGHIYIERLR